MLKQRVLTAIVLLAVFLGALFYAPQPLWLVLVSLICAGGAWEWGGLSGFSRRSRLILALCFGVLCLGLGFLLELHQPRTDGSLNNYPVAVFYLISAAFWLFCVPLWLWFKWRIVDAFVAVLTGLVVLIPTALALAHFRQVGAGMLLTVMVVVWLADTAAYFSGRLFGRHKLAPAISPGKTWEGVAGALLIVLLAGVGVYFGMSTEVDVSVLLPLMMVLALLVAVSIEGDLFESLLKRQAGIKDSGNILPGHGGILDRIDGLTSVLPLAALPHSLIIVCSFRIPV